MADGQTIFPISSKPGVKRDGTNFDGNFFSDGMWSRFQRGRARKIGGYRQLTTDFNGPVRGCHVHTHDAVSRVYAGYGGGVEYIDVDTSGGVTGVVDRTPAGFGTDANNVWQFDEAYDYGTNVMFLLASAVPTLSDIASETDMPVYYGDVDAAGALLDTGIRVSGGVCVSPARTFYYGTYGFITWSAPGAPLDISTINGGGGPGGQRVALTKIVKGLPVRGGTTNSPAALFWSLDAVVRASFIPDSAAIFRFDTITAKSTVLSSSGIIEYDGKFFWAGTDRFYVYTGVVQELPNAMNLNWFYDNLSSANRQKVWAEIIPHFGEIWWHFPYGDATECNAAIIFNVRENTWYDTGFAPGAQRTAGVFAPLFQYPVTFDANLNDVTRYSLWQHETGTDEVASGMSNAIRSYITTANIDFVADGLSGQWAGLNRWVNYTRVEPDFVQTGDMTMTFSTKQTARSTAVTTAYDFTPTTEYVDTRVQGRETTITFESNVAGGDYQMGECLLHVKPGDARI